MIYGGMFDFSLHLAPLLHILTQSRKLYKGKLAVSFDSNSPLKSTLFL